MMVIDFHTHILPKVDDGSASSEESVAMLQMQAQQGIRRVIATPHFYPQYDAPDAFLQRRDAAFRRLQEVSSKPPDLPEVILGAEVYYYHGISESEALSQLTIGEKKCILIEMPMPPWSDHMYRELEQIYSRRGLIPVIAHVDRYIAPMRTHGIPQRLAKLPVMVQANADFFLQRNTRRMAMRMLKQHRIHLLGSDCHNLSSRAPNMGQALELVRRRAGEQVLQWIYANQQELLE